MYVQANPNLSRKDPGRAGLEVLSRTSGGRPRRNSVQPNACHRDTLEHLFVFGRRELRFR